MKTQTLREKIEQIITDDDGKQPYKVTMDSILSLIHQELKECLKEKKPNGKYGLPLSDEFFYYGYNECISDIQIKLKEKGLI